MGAIEQVKGGKYRNTFFGKLYAELPCDLDQARLLLFGKLFGCLRDNIMLAGILSAPRNFFVSSKKIKSQKDIDSFHQVLTKHSEGRSCDFLILLNLFKAWSQKFGVDTFLDASKSL